MKGVLTRRSFAKMSLVASACVAVSGGTLAPSALAETVGANTEGSVKRIRSCCRACGKMECGVWVTVRDGRVTRVEGDESAFQSDGNCCAKSQSSMQAAYHPDRLHYPLRRTAPKTEAPGWERMSWDDAHKAMAEGFQVHH